MQSEAGVIIPPTDYLPRVRALCSEHDVLLVADEVQSGLARTGRTLACDHVAIEPDLVIEEDELDHAVDQLRAVLAELG